MANKQTKQNLYQLIAAQGDISDAQSNMIDAQRVITDVMKNMVKYMMDSVEDDIPLSSLKIQKNKKKTIIKRDILETKYDIIGIIEIDEINEIDEIDENMENMENMKNTDLTIQYKSMTSDAFYTINLTKKTCECLDFVHRSKKNPEHICKHLKEHFKNISNVNVN
jgi:hypothetical protein